MSATSAVAPAPVRTSARRTSASRAVAAANEAFPVVLSPSPLIRRDPLPTGKPKPIVRYANEAALIQATKRPDPLAEEQAQLAEFYTIVKGRTTLLSLHDASLNLVFQFTGDNLKAFVPLSRVSKRFYYLCFDLISKVTMIPTLTTTERLSRPGSMTSLALHLGKNTRGAHITSFSVIDSKAVSTLPRHIIGPEISKIGLQNVLSNAPFLTRLDIRSVVFRDHNILTDHFLADLSALCPKLEQLRVGVTLARCWDPQWWVKLPSLKEFVVGSRREDVDWQDPSPLTLHDDVFAMLRSPHHKWQSVKFWCALHASSFSQLVSPTAPFPEVRHLAINGVGNFAHVRPLEDVNLNAEGGANDKKKSEAAKAGKGKGGEDALGPRFMFPTLESITLADIQERPDFAAEFAAKLTVMAPQFQYYSVTNTHRSAPSKAAPVTVKPKRAAAAAS